MGGRHACTSGLEDFAHEHERVFVIIDCKDVNTFKRRLLWSPVGMRVDCQCATLDQHRFGVNASDWQSHPKGGALCFARTDASEGPAMQFDEVSGYRQTQP